VVTKAKKVIKKDLMPVAASGELRVYLSDLSVELSAARGALSGLHDILLPVLNREKLESSEDEGQGYKEPKTEVGSITMDLIYKVRNLTQSIVDLTSRVDI